MLVSAFLGYNDGRGGHEILLGLLWGILLGSMSLRSYDKRKFPGAVARNECAAASFLCKKIIPGYSNPGIRCRI
jgi:hypothetical protein